MPTNTSTSATCRSDCCSDHQQLKIFAKAAEACASAVLFFVRRNGLILAMGMQLGMQMGMQRCAEPSFERPAQGRAPQDEVGDGCRRYSEYQPHPEERPEGASRRMS